MSYLPACLPACLVPLLSSSRAVINPTDLRVALAEHTPFKCQEMNDANELLDTIYECFQQSQVRGGGWASAPAAAAKR